MLFASTCIQRISERAALAWAEAVTRLVDQQVPDEVYEQARAEFGETELAQLTFSVISINGWNRIISRFGLLQVITSLM